MWKLETIEWYKFLFADCPLRSDKALLPQES